MKNIPKIHISFKSPALGGLMIISMVVVAAVFLYGSYYKNGSTILSTIVEKTKTPTSDTKYPYNYYINVEFQPDGSFDKPAVAEIKIPGSTWKNMEVGSSVEIIYLLDDPTSAQLKKFLYNDMLMVFLVGLLFICISVFKKYYMKDGKSFKWKRSHSNPNQQVDPIVTTPVDKVEAQSTQGHP